ncbi:glycosyltransferase [Herpetosiphon gulosus]|uniref:Glycosyltransferase subfamily 4-like N-terminal domain-containing protein n=1 Tax=Herpetosiphon gulosus TaxID=1973496 RepID=A0ABP9WYV4_9CHLR
MRILFLTPYPAYPANSGGTQRMFQLLRELSRQHELWCLSLSPSHIVSAAAQPLNRYCHLTLIPAPRRNLAQRTWTTLTSPLPDMVLRAPSEMFRSALASLLNTNRFDLVQAESIEMAQYALQAQRWGIPATLDQWNAEYVLQQRAAQTDRQQQKRWHAALYSAIQWRKLARYERLVCNQLDQIYVVSPEDRAMLQKIGVKKTLHVVPNGVDSQQFSPSMPREYDPNTLLFTGSLDFRPNIDALRWFIQEVLPLIRAERPETKLMIVGRAPTPAVLQLAQPGVIEIIPNVPSVQPYFNKAAVFVLPMRMGGGVRLKLLEALATETPLVSTTMGADGVTGLVPNQHCLLADTPAEFAQATLKLLRERQFAQGLAMAARRFVAANYDWQAITERLQQAWGEISHG